MAGQEVIYEDGSMSTFTGGGGATHAGLGIVRLRLIVARQALEIYLKYDGNWQLTRDGHRLAVLNVIEPLSGKRFASPSGRVTKRACREALAECKALIAGIEAGAVVWVEGE